MTKLPRVTAIRMGPGSNIRLTFKGNNTREINLRGLIARSEYLAPLTDDVTFAQARVIDGGVAVGWPGDVDISAGLLWRIAEEQSEFAADDFNAWQKRIRLSNQEAADALGVALSTLKAMKSGETRISNAVAIACRAMEAEPAVLAAHFEPRSAGRPRKNPAPVN